MAHWGMFKKKYALDPEDLPIPNGPNIVVIEGVDTEQFKNDEGEEVTRTVLTLVGWSVPLRLNNEKIDTLAAMFGSNIEDAIGQKITLLSSFANIYGKTKPVIDIHPHVPDAEAVPVIVPAHLGCKSVFRMQRAMECGVRIASASAALPKPGQRPAGAAQQGQAGGGPGGAAAPVKQLTAATLGKERAAKLLQLLRVKNRTWTWLADALARDGMGELIIGKEPFDAAPAVAQLAWSKLKPLPDVGEVGTPEAMAAEVAATVAAWEPPAPPAATSEMVNKDTGEVVKPAASFNFKATQTPAPAVNDDDIPF